MNQAEGSKRKLQSLGLGDIEPGEYEGGDLHSNKLITVTSIEDAVVPVCDRSETSKPPVTFVSPSEQIVEQAKSEVKRDSADGALVSHVTITESPSVRHPKSARVDKQPEIKKQSGMGVTKLKKTPVKKRVAHSASSLDIFSR
jgi:hypothetical protein